MNLDQFRAQNPAYKDVPDGKLADALYSKFYSNMPREQFNAKIGLSPPSDSPAGKVGSDFDQFSNPEKSAPPKIPGEVKVGPLSVYSPATANGFKSKSLADIPQYVDQAVYQTPIVGPLVDKAGAALAATAGSGKGNTWKERYENTLASDTKAEDKFADKHPVGSAAAGALGTLATTGGVGDTAIGAKVLGKVGKSIARRMAYGGLSGAVIGATDAKLRGRDPLKEGAIWGLFGGLAPGVEAAAKPVVNAIGKNARALILPLSSRARESLANDTLSRVAAGGPMDVEASPIAGVKPTLAQATGNPGVAQLERTLRNRPGLGTEFTERDAANAEKRNSHYQSLSGDDQSVEMAKEARGDTADKNLTQAFGNKQPVDSKGIVRTIDNILASPAGQRAAVKSSLRSVRQRLVQPNPIEDRIAGASKMLTPKATATASAAKQDTYKQARSLLRQAKAGTLEEKDLVSGLTKLAKTQKTVGPLDDVLKIIKQGDTKSESDAEQLYGIRQHVGDLINPKDNSSSKLAAKELMQVRAALDRVIEKGAPGYKKYLSTFAEQSRPINVQEGLQKARVTDVAGNVTLGKVDNLIKTIETKRKAPGANWAKSMTKEEMDHLYALRHDLRMAKRSESGKAIGSNTVQNALSEISVNPALRRFFANAVVGGGLGYGLGATDGHPNVGALAGALAAEGYGHMNSKVEEDVLSRLASKALDGSRGVPIPRTSAARARLIYGIKNLRHSTPWWTVGANLASDATVPVHSP